MKRYVVTLDKTERDELIEITRKGSHSSQKVANALILLNWGVQSDIWQILRIVGSYVPKVVETITDHTGPQCRYFIRSLFTPIHSTAFQSGSNDIFASRLDCRTRHT